MNNVVLRQIIMSPEIDLTEYNAPQHWRKIQTNYYQQYNTVQCFFYLKYSIHNQSHHITISKIHSTTVNKVTHKAASILILQIPPCI